MNQNEEQSGRFMWFWVLVAAVVILFFFVIGLSKDVGRLRREISDLQSSVDPILRAEEKRRYIAKLEAAVDEGGLGSDVAAGMLRDEYRNL